jgi:hypothetical protein
MILNQPRCAMLTAMLPTEMIVSAVKSLRKASMMLIQPTNTGSPGLGTKAGSLATYFYAPHPTPGKGIALSPTGRCVQCRGVHAMLTSGNCGTGSCPTKCARVQLAEHYLTPLTQVGVAATQVISCVHSSTVRPPVCLLSSYKGIPRSLAWHSEQGIIVSCMYMPNVIRVTASTSQGPP